MIAARQRRVIGSRVASGLIFAINPGVEN